MKIVLPLLIALLALLFYTNQKETPIVKVEPKPTTTHSNDSQDNRLETNRTTDKPNTEPPNKIDTNNSELNRILENYHIESLYDLESTLGIIEDTETKLSLLLAWHYLDPAAPFEWLRDMESENTAGFYAMYSQLLTTYAETDIQAAAEEVLNLPTSLLNDQVALHFFDNHLMKDPSQAMSWIENLENDNLKQQLTETVVDDIANNKPTQFLGFAKDSGLDDELVKEYAFIAGQSLAIPDDNLAFNDTLNSLSKSDSVLAPSMLNGFIESVLETQNLHNIDHLEQWLSYHIDKPVQNDAIQSFIRKSKDLDQSVRLISYLDSDTQQTVFIEAIENHNNFLQDSGGIPEWKLESLIHSVNYLDQDTKEKLIDTYIIQ